jgi:RimJ/RimL family protein N-acetyltransferase
VTLPDVDLVPLTDAEYEGWLERATREYAAEHVRTGNWTEAESLDRAAVEMARLLPQGARTPGQYLWSIRPTDGEPVGLLWVGTERRPGHAFIYDIEMVEHRRGEGFGTAALLALEEWARERGITTIGLHVFGHNTGAWRLYQRLGYVETNVNMEKRL